MRPGRFPGREAPAQPHLHGPFLSLAEGRGSGLLIVRSLSAPLCFCCSPFSSSSCAPNAPLAPQPVNHFIIAVRHGPSGSSAGVDFIDSLVH